MLIAILNTYVRKWLILACLWISHLIINLSLRLINSTGPSNSASDLPYQPLLSDKSLTYWYFILSPPLFFVLIIFLRQKPVQDCPTQKNRQLVLGNVVDYKKFFCLHPGEYVQVHQDDEPRDTIDIYQTVRAIFLGPQYNLQGGFF